LSGNPQQWKPGCLQCLVDKSVAFAAVTSSVRRIIQFDGQ
jgi:hypothetical protein